MGQQHKQSVAQEWPPTCPRAWLTWLSEACCPYRAARACVLSPPPPAQPPTASRLAAASNPPPLPLPGFSRCTLTKYPEDAASACHIRSTLPWNVPSNHLSLLLALCFFSLAHGCSASVQLRRIKWWKMKSTREKGGSSNRRLHDTCHTAWFYDFMWNSVDPTNEDYGFMWTPVMRTMFLCGPLASV